MPAEVQRIPVREFIVRSGLVVVSGPSPTVAAQRLLARVGSGIIEIWVEPVSESLVRIHYPEWAKTTFSEEYRRMSTEPGSALSGLKVTMARARDAQGELDVAHRQVMAIRKAKSA